MSGVDWSKRVEYDPDSIAGARQKAFETMAARMMLTMHGTKAFALVSSDRRALVLGLTAFGLGWQADRVVAGLAEYIAARTRREAEAVAAQAAARTLEEKTSGKPTEPKERPRRSKTKGGTARSPRKPK